MVDGCMRREELGVADLAGPGRGGDDLEHLVEPRVIDRDIDLDPERGLRPTVRLDFDNEPRPDTLPDIEPERENREGRSEALRTAVPSAACGHAARAETAVVYRGR